MRILNNMRILLVFYDILLTRRPNKEFNGYKSRKGSPSMTKNQPCTASSNLMNNSNIMNN